MATRKPGKGSREVKLENFIANGREAQILVNQHWERLTGGLKVQELQGDPFSSDKRMRRIYHHHELRRLRLDTELHWLRRALSLMRHLRNFQEYLAENGHRPSDTSNHRMRHAYLVYLCGSLQLIRLEEVRYQDGFEGRSPICCSWDDLY